MASKPGQFLASAEVKRRTDLVTGRRKRAARGAWLVAILGVVVGSLLPAASLAMRVLNHLQISDKIQHFGAYAVLAFLPAVHERWRFIMVAGFGLMAMGYGLEVGQLYSPGRSYDLADFAADALARGLLRRGSGYPVTRRGPFPAPPPARLVLRKRGSPQILTLGSIAFLRPAADK